MKQKKHLAHLAKIDGKRAEQTVKEHSIQVAEYAAECLKSSGLYYTGYLAGLIHDCGKSKKAMTGYLEAAFEGKAPPRGSVNHTFAAVKFIMQHYWEHANTRHERLACEILAVAVGSHHGLFDLEDPTGMKKENGLFHRVDCDDEAIGYTEATNNFFQEVTDQKTMDEYFAKALEEITSFIKRMEVYAPEYKSSGMSFMFGLLTRLITSAVIEGDRRDTAEFMNGETIELHQADQNFWQSQIEYMEEQLKNFHSDTPLNKVRADISNQCKAFAKEKGGIHRLTVQTGSGKTLASLRYALAHAAEYNKERIIYIIPLLSVLDQNSKDIHTYIKDNQCILEHHSNLVITTEDQEELDKRELMTETWDAPVIISTLVQLLNILFSHKTTAIRRMNSLCNSVIIIDEVQSLPLKFGELFNMAMNFLAEYCGTTIILCSATQPAFEQLKWPLHLSENVDLVKEKPEYEQVFRRTSIINRITPQGMTLDELSDFAVQNVKSKDSLLIICNTKKTARELYKKLKLMKQDDWELYHLSTSMCKKHRNKVLNQIGKTPGLNEQRKVICISTQLVEAGIDFSFESVIRVWAGLDSIVQAAGRCNRNNDWKKICPVYIVNLQNESLGSLKYIEQGQKTLKSVLHEVEDQEDQDYLSPTFTERYFKWLYSTVYSEKETQFIVEVHNQSLSIRTMLSTNGGLKCNEPYYLKQAFKTAGENCKVFDDDKLDVIVVYDEKAKAYQLNLTSAKAQNDIQYVKEQLEKLKPYTVSLFKDELQALREDDKLEEEIFPGVIFLDKSAYSDELGVCIGEYFIDDDILMS